MGAIWDVFKSIYAALAIIPLLPFAIVFFGYGAYIQDRKKALLMAMDVSTAFLIPCVGALFVVMLNTNFGFYGILLMMLLGGGLLGNAQFRKRGAVNAKRIFRAVWRMTFFLTSVLYIILMLVAIGKSFVIAF
ncbi:hypothetical protein A7K91_05355 [Paenibacillus oryzae]|uniref:DUF3397 domain-containing protein n=1 Tax=Paenibacillus oryzae TaxID=1844972 RepID=A0A1A5YHD0_9BACL|nr:DUF3397 domain-containing protein [Paenibacillus oryzae]OBR64997.1 hypothetical protein A7K91_05355 [Paenibacillus oryzae]